MPTTSITDHAVGPVATREMTALHSVFRRELGRAAALVRGVRPGDRRAAVVGHHLDLVERFLHHHHTIEDELLWPTLLERVPAEIAPVVELMESQHEVVDACLQRALPLRGAWQETAGRDAGETLAALYDRLHSALVEHLEAEESRVMPLVEDAVSTPEWARLADAGRRSFRGRESLLVFGLIQACAGDEVVAEMLADAPAPVRAILPRLARRAYRSHERRLSGATDGGRR